MLRCLTKNLKQKWPKISTRSSFLQYRNLSDEIQIVIGGGLDKPQGGLKEEKYFCAQNYDLMVKLREKGAKLKCENRISDWKEFEKGLNASETCSLNKHKNCLEEAFFLNEQHECCTKLRKENKIIEKTNLEGITENLQKLKKVESKVNEDLNN